MFVGYKSNLVRVIGNVSFRNKAVQDRVREMGAIYLILNQMNLDENNPCEHRRREGKGEGGGKEGGTINRSNI